MRYKVKMWNAKKSFYLKIARFVDFVLCNFNI